MTDDHDLIISHPYNSPQTCNNPDYISTFVLLSQSAILTFVEVTLSILNFNLHYVCKLLSIFSKLFSLLLLLLCKCDPIIPFRKDSRLNHIALLILLGVNIIVYMGCKQNNFSTLSSHLRLGLLSGLFLRDISIKIWHEVFTSI
jgi:hypothetical protein